MHRGFQPAHSPLVVFSCLLFCLLSFKAVGMDWFDSINYAMTTIATGGFATHNDSIAFFHSPIMEYVSTFFCFISGINFILLYRFTINREVKSLLNNSEVKFYVGVVTTFTAFIMVQLIHH